MSSGQSGAPVIDRPTGGPSRFLTEAELIDPNRQALAA